MTAGGRRVVNHVMGGLTALAAGLVILPLVLIFAFLLFQGASAVNVEFFTHLPKPVGEEGGGMANAIVGSLILIGLAAGLGLPIGILGGVYLAESRDRRLPWIVRFLADVLNGVPSIVVGIFAYGLVVLPMRRFSALAGAVALAVIMLPIVVRTSEELVRLVPASLREAALALGIPEWKVVLRVVLPTARAGIVTGVMVAIARVAGETAPLLFTAFGNRTEIAISLFAPGHTMASVIANEFTEATSDLYLAALIEVGLLLFLVTVAVNALARLLVWSVGGAVKVTRE